MSGREWGVGANGIGKIQSAGRYITYLSLAGILERSERASERADFLYRLVGTSVHGAWLGEGTLGEYITGFETAVELSLGYDGWRGEVRC
jgi:hypothetical protein